MARPARLRDVVDENYLSLAASLRAVSIKAHRQRVHRRKFLRRERADLLDDGKSLGIAPNTALEDRPQRERPVEGHRDPEPPALRQPPSTRSSGYHRRRCSANFLRLLLYGRF